MVLTQRLKSLYQRYERWVPIVFFLLGFLFDAVMLGSIDDPKAIAQQVLYLVLIAAILSYDFLFEANAYQPGPRLAKVWRYREAFLHFIMGTLMNVYSIFYFKSASLLTSLIFVGVLTIVLVLNEFVRFGKSQRAVHVALFSLCLISFFIYIVPMVLGFIGVGPFLGAVAASVLCFLPLYRFLKRRLGERFIPLRSQLVLPFLGIQLVFALLYFFKAIPPVPLSTSYIGIFHNIERNEETFRLFHMRPWWRIWETGDQTFYARTGDMIYCFAQLFSPTGFKDDLLVRWLYKDQRGWHPSDAIPMQITGGRREGYRGVTFKSNYQPGKWRVQIETSDGREVGRIQLWVINDDGTTDRQFAIEQH
ncbi:MAG: DUF2914 domain-containing protein [Pseudomonadota bacterium]